MSSILLEPVTLGALNLQNRVIMAPLTRNRAHEDGTPAQMAVEYYRQRAGAGMIITEATQISPLAKGYINTPGIYNDEHIAGWKPIVEAVHQAGGTIVCQLWHVGRISHVSLLPEGEQPLAPSAIRANAQTVTADGRTDVSEPRAMTLNDIQQTIADYAHAAKCAKLAGFDGVEIHAANGYLLDQFIQDGTNKRDDAYGGTIENRIRLLKEVVEAVVGVMGAGRVGIRLSPLGQYNDMADSDPEATFGAVIAMLNHYDLAYMHTVERFPGKESSKEELSLLERLAAQFTNGYIACGGFGKPDGEAYIETEKADAIAYGRPFIANPDLPERFRQDAALNEPDPATFYGGDERGYTDYPTLDQQRNAA